MKGFDFVTLYNFGCFKYCIILYNVADLQDLQLFMDSYVIESTAESQGREEVQEAIGIRQCLAKGGLPSCEEAGEDPYELLTARTLILGEMSPKSLPSIEMTPKSKGGTPDMAETKEVEPGMPDTEELETDMAETKEVEPCMPDTKELETDMAETKEVEPGMPDTKELETDMAETKEEVDVDKAENNNQAKPKDDHQIQPKDRTTKHFF